MVIMQARSSTTGAIVTWTSSTPDFAAAGFPGPGTAIDVAVAGDQGAAAGGAPTGTGLPHIVAGVQQAAASLLVDADVAAAAAIALTKLRAPTGTGLATVTAGAWDAAATANLSYASGGLIVNASGYLALGTSPAAAGWLRFPSAAGTIIQAGTSVALAASGGEVFLGTDASYANQSNNIRAYASGSVNLGIASTTHLNITANGIALNTPIRASASSPIRYSTLNLTLSADYTLTTSDYVYPYIRVTSSTAAWSIIAPAFADVTLVVKNLSANTVTFKVTGQTGVAIAAGTTKLVRLNAAGTDYEAWS